MLTTPVCGHIVSPVNGPRRNAALRDAIFRSGLRQNDVARKAGINRSILSQIINGRTVATEAEREAIADAVGLPVERLFADDSHSVAS